MGVGIESFNLVIEILFFSSYATTGAIPTGYAFQSRNRDTFLFKSADSESSDADIAGFNLVIEILFFSSNSLRQLEDYEATGFQSRNRDTFLFKYLRPSHRGTLTEVSIS